MILLPILFIFVRFSTTMRVQLLFILLLLWIPLWITHSEPSLMYMGLAAAWTHNCWLSLISYVFKLIPRTRQINTNHNLYPSFNSKNQCLNEGWTTIDIVLPKDTDQTRKQTRTTKNMKNQEYGPRVHVDVASFVYHERNTPVAYIISRPR